MDYFVPTTKISRTKLGFKFVSDKIDQSDSYEGPKWVSPFYLFFFFSQLFLTINVEI